jgi:hypothetical protein
MDEAAQLHDRTTARISPVQGPHVGQANTWQNRLIANGIAFGIMLGPIAFFFFAIFYLMPRVIPPLVGLGWIGIATLFALFLGVPLLLLVETLYTYKRSIPLRMLARYHCRCLTSEILRRPEPCVSPSDPEALYTQLRLRRHWSLSQDHMFEPVMLRVSYQHRGILGEGDTNRYWIPAEAILRCAVELPTCQAPSTLAVYATVLLVRLGGGTWELPFVPLTRIEGKTFWDQAMALRQRILLLRPPHLAAEAPITPPPPPHIPVV